MIQRSTTATTSVSARRAARARELGQDAERLVVEHVRLAGMNVLGTNVKVGRYEVDVLAQDGRVIVIVEVRARGATSWTTGFGSIDARKRQSIRRAADRLWRSRYRDDASVDRIRIDAASVTFEGGSPVVEYVRAAF